MDYCVDINWDILMVNLVSTDDEVLGTILGNVYGIIFGIDFGTELGYLDESFDGSNDVNLEGLFLGCSLGYTDGKMLGYDEHIKMVSTGGNLIGTILGNVDVITLEINVGT